MTITELVQLYAPLAGLLVMAFWVGALSNRVATLEREERDRKTRDQAELNERDRMVRVETKLESVETKLESVERELGSVHRLIANLATGQGGKLIRFGDD